MMPSAEFAARALEALDALPLEVLHGMPLECDGASQALSQVLLHAGIDHAIHIGSLTVDGSGHIPLHWWVTLPNGLYCDIRARMWLGDAPGVPHGVFLPTAAQHYQSKAMRAPVKTAVLFSILTSQDLDAFVASITSADPAHPLTAA